MLYVSTKYERYLNWHRPMQQSWLRSRLNRLHTVMDIAPYFVNKVDRELERQKSRSDLVR
jgi:hypothetical protein